MPIKPVSVSQLNSYIGRVLATDPILCSIAVKGEISKLTRHSSGHWYFTLKDANARVNCFLPSHRAAQVRYDISDGMEIIVYGSVSVYEAGGTYSITVRDLEAEGEGALKLAFENLKKKLEKEGLFNTSHKRAIPADPKNIGVITSPTGAAVRDIISTVKRRNPLVNILLYPCLVQGAEAARSICSAIENMNKDHPDLDVLIVGRGGGSAEDLWPFNEETVARSIYGSKIPVISAVGHEVDFLISDFTADLRGATPTAAAELAVPHIDNYKDILARTSPVRLFKYIENQISDYEYRLKMLKLAIESNDPKISLSKGYAMVCKNGDVVSSSSQIVPGDKLNISFADGSINAVAVTE